MKENKKSRNWFNIEYRHIQNKKLVVTVSVLLRLSVVGTLVAQAFNGNFENVYTCILALILFTIPSLIERRLHIDLPDTLETLSYFSFIYAAEILGEIQEYYVIIPFWDDILHTLNGFLFAAVGFSGQYPEPGQAGDAASVPLLHGGHGLCFSMTIGVLWEFLSGAWTALWLRICRRIPLCRPFIL